MSKRSNTKCVTTASRTLKFLRQQARLSVRAASRASGVGDGVINHVENGRINVHPHHLAQLLPAYGVTMKTYEMFVSGGIPLPENLHAECISLINSMSVELLRTAHPVLKSLAAQKQGGI